MCRNRHTAESEVWAVGEASDSFSCGRCDPRQGLAALLMPREMLQWVPKSSFPQTPPDSGSSPVCWRPRQARDDEQPLLKAVVGIENYYLQPTGLDTLHSRTESWSGSPETTLETGPARCRVTIRLAFMLSLSPVKAASPPIWWFGPEKGWAGLEPRGQT